MDASAAIQLLLNAHRLRQAPRTGRVMRGVTGTESVADHSPAVALTPLVLSESVDQPLDKCRLSTIALLHDLPENAIGDLPTPVEVPSPLGAEREAEMLVLSGLLRTLPYAEEWHAWWRKSVDGTSGVWRCG